MDTDFESKLLAGGLSAKQVAERVREGKANIAADVHTRSIPRILRDNICTLFNLINLILAIAIFWTGSYRNLFFMFIIIFNVAIGIFQEIRSKISIDRLSVISSVKAHVIREGRLQEIALHELVLDDVVRLGRGDQVPADCRVLSGKCAANESLLTGESDLIPKTAGDNLMSGSFVSAGACTAKVTAVGADMYANKINNAARVYKKAHSDIMNSLDKIIRAVTVLLIPLGTLLFCKELFFTDTGQIVSSILHTSAALIGMIPQGLILLTSAVFAVSVIRLSEHKVLVQQLYCVETLARVDVVCLDKTGTITTGRMKLDELVCLDGVSYDSALHALHALDAVVGSDMNETARAVHEYVKNLAEPDDADALVKGATRLVPFSSEHKYSGVCYGSDAGNYALGAAEFVLRTSCQLSLVQDMMRRLAGPRRCLVVARVDDFDDADAIVGAVTPLALVFIKDELRSTAKETLAYFAQQGVRVNIISGDDVKTVSQIAELAGVEGADKAVDMSTINSSAKLSEAARQCRVFGRVSPEQKRQLVEELQAQGHTVAMTGDGVNDVLALHRADCSVAMGSGSDAARCIAQLILMDDDFASLPHVVAEGRRSINNLQRSAVLFLVKTLFSMAFALLFIPIVAYNYPFVTIQLTLIDAFTIGLPSFVLALEPNHELVRGEFLRNVIAKALPGACAIVLGVVVAVIAAACLGLDQYQFQTMCVMLTCITGVNLVVHLSFPFNAIRTLLLLVILVGLFLGIFVFGSFFMLSSFTVPMFIATAVIALAMLACFNILYLKIPPHIVRNIPASYL